jgi:hypothetical protein
MKCLAEFDFSGSPNLINKFNSFLSEFPDDFTVLSPACEMALLCRVAIPADFVPPFADILRAVSLVRCFVDFEKCDTSHYRRFYTNEDEFESDMKFIRENWRREFDESLMLSTTLPDVLLKVKPRIIRTRARLLQEAGKKFTRLTDFTVLSTDPWHPLAAFLLRVPYLYSLPQKTKLLLTAIRESNRTVELEFDRSKPLLPQFTRQLSLDAMPTLIHFNRAPFTVSLEREEAHDLGGPARDTFSQLCVEIGQLFQLTPNGRRKEGLHQDCLIPKSSADLQELEYVGCLLGLCFASNLRQPFRFPPVLWKFLILEKADASDIYEIDKSLFEMFQSGSAETLINEKWDGSPLDFIPETAEQIEEERRKEIEKPLAAIRKGFVRIIPEKHLCLFSGRECERLVCGERDLPVDRLMELIHPSNDSIGRVEQLAAALGTLSDQERFAFLRFATGTAGLPPIGFPQPDIAVEWFQGPQLPIAHTCFSRVEVPICETADELARRFRVAFEYCDTFELT